MLNNPRYNYKFHIQEYYQKEQTEEAAESTNHWRPSDPTIDIGSSSHISPSTKTLFNRQFLSKQLQQYSWWHNSHLDYWRFGSSSGHHNFSGSCFHRRKWQGDSLGRRFWRVRYRNDAQFGNLRTLSTLTLWPQFHSLLFKEGNFE